MPHNTAYITLSRFRDEQIIILEVTTVSAVNETKPKGTYDTRKVLTLIQDECRSVL